MFKHYVIAAGLLLASTALAENDLSALEGYQSHFASAAFNEFLKEDDHAYAYFEDHMIELQKVLSDRTLQNRLVSGEISVEDLTQTLDEQFVASQVPLETAEQRAANDLARAGRGGSTSVNGRVTSGDSGRAVRDLSGAGTTKPVEEGTVGSEPVRNPPAVTPVELSDLNQLPEGGVDAKGWPKYLKVPANCPAPKADVHYKYASDQWFKMSGPDGTRTVPPRMEEENGYSHEIKHYLTTGGMHRWHRLADQEVYAVPFISPAVINSKLMYPEDSSAVSWSDQNPAVRPVTPVLSISECPGVLEAEGSQSYQSGGVVTGVGAMTVTSDAYAARQAAAETAYQANPRNGKGGALKPGARYFLNIGYKAADTCARDYASIGMTNFRKDSRGKAICGGFFSATGYGLGNRPPYTGACLNQGPYPLNYDSMNCQGSNFYGTASGEGSVKYRCFDPKGELAETRYEMKVINGLVRWVQGGGKPAPARLICASSATADWDNIPIHEICSRTTAGYRQSIQILSYGRYPVKRQITECKKDTAQGNAFAWKALVADDMGPMGVGGFMQSGSNHMVIVRYLDAEGNEIARSTQGDGRTGVNEGFVIDPRWDDPAVTTGSLKP